MPVAAHRRLLPGGLTIGVEPDAVPGQHCAQQHPELEGGQRTSGADVRAGAVDQVGGGMAVRIVPVRVVEHGRVTVGRGPVDQQLVARVDRLRAQCVGRVATRRLETNGSSMRRISSTARSNSRSPTTRN